MDNDILEGFEDVFDRLDSIRIYGEEVPVTELSNEENSFEKHDFEKSTHHSNVSTSTKKKPTQLVFTNKDKAMDLEKNLKNYRLLIDKLGYTIAKNIINKTIIVENKNFKFPTTFTLDNKINFIKQHLGEKYNFRLTQTESFELFDQTANTNVFNPVTNFLEDNYRKTNDKQGAIKELASKLITTNDYDDEIKELFLKSWMINAVKVFHNTLDEAIPLEGVLTLQGEQGTYKTRFTQAIVPNQLKTYYKSGVSVDPNNRDSKSQTLSYGFVELGEVDSIMSKREQSDIKAFITETKDIWRTPYDRHPTEYARTTVFMATVNPEEFLKDNQNRRWYVIPIKQILIDEITDELVCRAWAEAYQLAIIDKSSHYIDPKIINQNSEHFRVKSNSECRIDNYFDWTEPKEKWRFYSCQELAKLFNLPTTRGLTAMMRSIDSSIEIKQKKINKKMYKGFILPSREDDEVNQFYKDIYQ